jgi:hypothetical protein
MRQTILYCCKRPPDNNGVVYHHFADSAFVARLYDGESPIVRVRVREAREGEEPTHWGWWDNEQEKFAAPMTWGARFLVNMCFAYGSKVEEEHGRGHVLPVVVTEEET